MKRALITGLTALSLFGIINAEEPTEAPVQEMTCRSSFRVYNNTSQTVIIHNAQDIDTVPSGSYSYVYGECGSPVEYSVEGEYKLADGSSATCSYKAAGTRTFPTENGAIESIGLTALCGNEEKVVEVKSFTDTIYKYSNWSKGDPKEYIYGLKIKATSPNGVLANTEFILSDKNGTVMTDVTGQDAIITTDDKGEATVYLYAGYSYFIKESKVDSKWSILNGEIVVESTNATVLKADEFAPDKVEEYYLITFENQMSADEEKLQENLSAKRKELTEFKETTLKKIDSIYKDKDDTAYNKNAYKKAKTLKEEITQELNNYIDEIDNNLEEDLRNEKEVSFKFNLGDYETALNKLNGHWYHWVILGLTILMLGLHFIYNKHMMINILLIPTFVLYINDICKLSQIFFIISIVECCFFTILEVVLNKKEKAD